MVLDHTVRPPVERDPAPFGRLKAWERGLLLRVLRQLIEQTKGRDQQQLVAALADTGFKEQALTDLRHGFRLRRLYAANLLGHFSDDDSIRALHNAFTDRDAAVRLAAARALLQRDRIHSLAGLLNGLGFSRKDPPLILAEIFAQLPERLVPEAVQLLDSPLPPEWLRMLAIALGRRQVGAAYNAFAALRHNVSPRVRAAAWVALTELGDPRAGELVAGGLQDSSPDVRRAAALCAGRLGGSEVLPLLSAMLKDGDWSVAWGAALALLQSGPGGRALLSEHSHNAPEGDAGRQALLEQTAEAAS